MMHNRDIKQQQRHEVEDEVNLLGHNWIFTIIIIVAIMPMICQSVTTCQSWKQNNHNEIGKELESWKRSVRISTKDGTTPALNTTTVHYQFSVKTPVASKSSLPGPQCKDTSALKWGKLKQSPNFTIPLWGSIFQRYSVWKEQHFKPIIWVEVTSNHPYTSTSIAF